MARWWRHWFCLQYLFLAVFQTPTAGYLSVNFAFHCLPEAPPTVLHLQSKGPLSAALVELNVRSPYTATIDRESGAARCRLEVTAPSGHDLIVHLDHPKFFPSKSSEKRQGFLPCFLQLSHTDKASDGTRTLHKEASRNFDLCDDSEMVLSALFMTNRLSLAWFPPDAHLARKMVAKRLVITAVGRSMDVCNSRNRFFCLEGGNQFPHCISSELVCDGYNNCPLAGDEENSADCEATALKGDLFLPDLGFPGEGRQSNNRHNILETILKKVVLKSLTEDKSGKRDVISTTTPKPGQNKQTGFELTSSILRDVSDIILKKVIKTKGVQVTEPRNSTKATTTTKPPWPDDSEEPSLPAALAHYGPWGYLMFGMLICGAILMLCGLWECCCRSSKHRLPAGGPTSTSAATTVFIINSAGGIGSHRGNSDSQQDESPPTPGPPSYEELDQPPPYSALFPMTKVSSTQTFTADENNVISGQHI